MSAANDLVMPKLGLTMTEGMLAEWRVNVGNEVASGDILFVVETEKITTEIEAPAHGVIQEILVQAGETVPVGTVIGRWTGTGIAGVSHPEEGPTLEPARSATVISDTPAAKAGRVLATPLARRLARQRTVDLATVKGSGPRGRIKAQDVLRTADRAVPPRPSGGNDSASSIERIAGQRLAAAKRDIPHFYLSADADMTQVLILRGRASSGTKPTINDVIVAAAGRALYDLPALNRVWSNAGPRPLGTVDIGLAVHTVRGLYAPVQHDIGALPLHEISARLRDLIGRARENRLKIDDLSGGVLTVSNAGMYGIKTIVPIINPGQAAILGVGAVQDVFRPNACGVPVLRHELCLSLAADHRVLDGVAGAQLLNRIIHYIEHPAELQLPGSMEKNS